MYKYRILIHQGNIINWIKNFNTEIKFMKRSRWQRNYFLNFLEQQVPTFEGFCTVQKLDDARTRSVSSWNTRRGWDMSCRKIDVTPMRFFQRYAWCQQPARSSGWNKCDRRKHVRERGAAVFRFLLLLQFARVASSKAAARNARMREVPLTDSRLCSVRVVHARRKNITLRAALYATL